ncbi:MAG: TetR/AcrR family transcriptional regulator [Mycobacterium sp.]|nr:TetR/AcrR family transcriptional regulator [Mycobacterium sp.]
MRRVSTPPAATGKVDARGERWREYRKKVRAEIVDAAFRAMDKCGPDVSLQQIAVEAGTAKPKIYRHFNDKADLFHAIAERLRDLLWASIFPNIDFAADSTREVVGRAVAEYVALVEQHPNVVRFVLQGRLPGRAQPTGRALSEGREITMAMAEMFNVQLREMQLDPTALELAAAAAFGSVSAATDWWLGPNPDSLPRMPSVDFVEHLTTIMLGTVSGTANLLGVDLDPGLPIRSATPRDAALGGLARHA